MCSRTRWACSLRPVAAILMTTACRSSRSHIRLRLDFDSHTLSGRRGRCRSPPPTDPDVQISRIRLLTGQFRSSSAIWSATGCWIYCEIEMPTRSHHGWNVILASRSSRAIVPAFLPRAPVAVLPMQRRSPTAASSPEPGRSVASGRRSPSQGGQRRRKGHGVRDGRKRRRQPSPKLDCLRRSRRQIAPPDWHERENCRTLACSGR